MYAQVMLIDLSSDQSSCLLLKYGFTAFHKNGSGTRRDSLIIWQA